MNHRPIVCCWVLFLAVAWVPCQASGSPAPTAELPVASLSQSSFVLDARGTLFAWGDNQHGQLGIGPKSANPRAEEPLPVAVPFPAGVKRWLAMAPGSWHSLAIGDDGKVYACGANSYKQLGTEDPADKLTFTQVPLPDDNSNWIAVAAGEHSLALTSEGQLFGWGCNVNGELGLGNRDNQATAHLFTFPPGVSRWVAMAAGELHTLVIGDNGLMYGCGANYYGQLGLGNNDQQTILQPVVFPFGVTAWQSVAASFTFSLALGNDGFVYAWGQNSEGQLGNGSTAQANVPMRVGTPEGVTQWKRIAAGGDDGFALSTEGTLYAWGAHYGTWLLPQAVAWPDGPQGWADIAGGRGHATALGTDCRIYQWKIEMTPTLLPGFETFCNPPTNQAPVVTWLNPTNGASLAGPALLGLEAMANDTDGSIVRVDFYADDRWLGEGIAQETYYTFHWPDAPPGRAVITARATDNLGLSAVSTPITVAVLYSNLNTIQIEIVDDGASEIGPHSGLCRIRRTGTTDASLRVDFALGGTAGNLDYAGLNYIYYSNYMVMPPGVTETEIGIHPLPDRLAEGDETVVFTLLNRSHYNVGFSNQATLTIADDPASSHYGELYVDLLRPSPYQTFLNTPPVVLSAIIYGPILPSTVVEFFDGANRLGASTNSSLQPERNLFEWVWMDPPVAMHVLTATTPGTNGTTVSSMPVTIQVIAPTNAPNIGISDFSPTFQAAQIQVLGQPNGIYAIQYSTNFVNWQFLSTGYSSNGVIQFIDMVARDSPPRFYRAVIMP